MTIKVIAIPDLESGEKMKHLIRIISSFCIIILLFTAINSWNPFFGTVASEEVSKQLSTITGSSDTELIESTAFKKQSYDSYIEKYKDAAISDKEVMVNAKDVSSSTYVEIVNNFEGRTGESVKMDEEGFVEYKVQIPEDGFYNINIEYYPIKGKGSQILRTLEIDGKIPYEEARELGFSRIWTNESAISQDAAGNDVRPKQIEDPRWTNKDLTETSGYYTDPLKFYFSSGEHSIKLIAVKEPLMIGDIKLYSAEKTREYEVVMSENQGGKYKNTENQFIKIQGEDATYKSSSMIYPIFDRSSPKTENSDPAIIRLNTIGGDKWKYSGQWITWNVTVPVSGFYKIGIKARQNIISGSYSTRKLFINGKIPYKETEAIKFNYSTEWKIQTLSSNNKEMLFYFDEGKNEIKLEVSLGDLASLQQQVNASMSELNTIYRKILMITGPSPDIYRDYQFHKQIPDVIKSLTEQSDKLKELYENYKTITGQNGEQAQILKKLYVQTAAMSKDPKTIASRFLSFKNNIVALGTWTLTAKEQPLEIDYIILASPEQVLPDVNANFWEQTVYAVKSFLASFFADYSSISGSSKSEKAQIRVWLGNSVTGGRDQAQVLKKMIDNDFTSKKGINVDLQLVSINSLLTATLAKKGPDVALTLSGSDPVNYAVRNAVLDLAKFPDCNEVLKRFMPSSLVPLSFNKGVYGLPESQTFYMLFYRKDILNDLGLEIPRTWDDVITMLPVLQKKQLDFGLPQVLGEGVGLGFNAYAMFLYQNGGSFYKDDGISSSLNNEKAVNAFFQWTKLYTDYNIPRQYDFLNRFRVGEVPIGIADYNTYNILSIFAPEINGLWEFAEVPGIMQTDGTIDRSVAGSITACSIMAATKNKEASWEFIKWWTDKDAQVDFGLELESIMGSAARYSPANIDALNQIPWSKKDFDKIKSQWQYVKGIPEVPGGYFTPRYIDFAFRKVIINGEDPGESIEDAAKTINIEINTKRKEFKLETK